MIPGYQYLAMLITGILHAIVGLCAAIIAIAGMSGAELIHQVIRVYCGVALFVAFWILMIGALGISAGIKKLPDVTTMRLKTAYMVTAILSACIFSLVGLTMYCLTFVLAGGLHRNSARFVTLGHVGSVFMAVEFVLAIVSASICCCCSNTNPNTMVVIQAPAESAPAVQYQSPPIYQPGAPVKNP